MARSIRYHPAFASDVVQAAAWYDERQSGLGTDFVARVQNAVSDLIKAPQRRSRVDFGIRYWPVTRFPYVVFYDFTDSEILVLGVMHTSQNYEKWRARHR
jgi:hypothetical protein